MNALGSIIKDCHIARPGERESSEQLWLYYFMNPHLQRQICYMRSPWSLNNFSLAISFPSSFLLPAEQAVKEGTTVFW